MSGPSSLNETEAGGFTLCGEKVPVWVHEMWVTSSDGMLWTHWKRVHGEWQKLDEVRMTEPFKWPRATSNTTRREQR